jgi:hypothetical protein
MFRLWFRFLCLFLLHGRGWLTDCIIQVILVFTDCICLSNSYPVNRRGRQGNGTEKEVAIVFVCQIRILLIVEGDKGMGLKRK